MRDSQLTFLARGFFALGAALSIFEASHSSIALPVPGPSCVYSTTCTTGGYTDPNNTCSVPSGAGPATAGTGTAGTEVYFANGACADEYDSNGNPTGYGCGDSYADTPC